MLHELHQLGIKKNTVVDWNNYLLEICTADLLANPAIIGGLNTTAEVDGELVYLKKTHQSYQLSQ